MNTLISLLLSIINNTLTDNTAREIARQLIRAYKDFDNIKASEIAERSFCNTSTVNRFCKSLGFQSFLDLKAYITVSHGVRKAQLLHHMEMADEKKILSNIEMLANGPFEQKAFIEMVQKFNDLLARSPYAVVEGAVYPESLSFHYMEDMIEMGKCMYNLPINRKLEVPVEDPDAVIILISFTGRLFRYCTSEFMEITEKYPSTIVMSADSDFLKNSLSGGFRLPFQGDDEVNNAAFIEIMRYMKHDYFKRYYNS